MSLQSQLAALRGRYSKDLSKDEAFELAYQAAELHMKFLTLAKDKNEKLQIRDKCNFFLNKAETIKAASSDDWQPDSDLFNEFPTGAPSNVELVSSASASTHGVTVSTSSQLGTDALKATPRLLPAPKNSRTLTTREKIILLQGSKLHGFRFPAWESPPSSSEFQPIEGLEGGLFEDEQGQLRLSPEQQSILDGWKRPVHALPPPSWSLLFAPDEAAKPLEPTMEAVHKADFVQDAATDCSVVASLAAGTARAQLGHPRILSTIIYPYIAETGWPAMSPNGKYVFRLYFNGCERRVVIDDRLPVSKTRRILHVVDRQNPGLLWPALLEKAYLKVRGGYDFPGSNSGTDLWILSGWIPEQIFLQLDETDTNYLWPRILKAFHCGDVMVTLGTGKMTPEAERQSGLAGSHDYAVLNMIDDENGRRLLVKNPWLKGTSWKDHRVLLPTIVESDDDDNNDDEAGDSAHNTSTTTASPSRDPREGPGVFWMEMADLLQYFDSIYLNWNPGLFSIRQDIHFQWDLSSDTRGGRSAPGSFTRNPQYAVTCNDSGLIWLLLSRHFSDYPGDASSSNITDEGFISLYAFSNRGQRVNLSRGAIKHGLYVDSPQALLQLEVDAKGSYTIVLSEEDLAASIHRFTLSVFSNCAFKLDEAPSQFAYRTKEVSRWSHESAGGNASSETYAKNPQFSLNLSYRSTVSLVLETLVPNVGVNCKILHGHGERVFSVTTKDLVADSGNYHRGCAHAQVEELAPGTYTIVCSTFEAGQVAEFSLLVESSMQHIVKPIPRVGAGRLQTRLADAFFESSTRLLAAPLRPTRLSRANFYANHADSVSSGALSGASRSLERFPSVQVHSPIRLTLESGRGPDHQIIAASCDGVFSDSACGVRTRDVDLDPGMTRKAELWLVLERLGGVEAMSGSEERFIVEMWADTLDGVRIGDWIEFER